MGSRVTIDFIGSQQVPAITDGSESKPGGSVEEEVAAFTHPSVATFTVQENTWFDERVMLEWVETCWAHVVTEPSVLIIDSLKIHKLQSVRRALAELGTIVEYVPQAVPVSRLWCHGTLQAEDAYCLL
ncbi:TPA: hypothetical protein N0F65_006829 [Lagenidium giganteum]|uniref:DDE-1 domain-containing protein n=1 Tax=Lagenidium giganteum TaxID=4803 RepID=A0AAV2ZHD1_9STRA|nr:TPA: hypothetical protein N0F65_006829 [Lagenidium giganteum]